MASNSNIEWTDATWNPVSGCTRASPGCDNCYAVLMTYRLERMGQVEKYGGLTVLNNLGDRHFNGVVRTHEDVLAWPMTKRKPLRIFVNSMSDLFHKNVPFDFIDKVFAVMALTPWHTYQILTKRADRCAEYVLSRTAIDDSHRVNTLPQWYQVYTRWFDDSYGGGRFFPDERSYDRHYAAAEAVDPTKPLANVLVGFSAEDQANFDVRWLQMKPVAMAGWKTWLSGEPLIGRLSLAAHPDARWAGSGLKWVVVGGESGSNARPAHPDWIRTLRDDSVEAGIPFLFKQWGEHAHESTIWTSPSSPDAGTINIAAEKSWLRLMDRDSFGFAHQFDDASLAYPVGKKASGRILDLREWNEFPEKPMGVRHGS